MRKPSLTDSNETRYYSVQAFANVVRNYTCRDAPRKIVPFHYSSPLSQNQKGNRQSVVYYGANNLGNTPRLFFCPQNPALPCSTAKKFTATLDIKSAIWYIKHNKKTARHSRTERRVAETSGQPPILKAFEKISTAYR